MLTIYPLLFEANLHPIIWGGNRLAKWKKLSSETDSTQNIGESWEVSTIPSSVSVIANGPLAGKDLAEVIAECPDGILGKAVAQKYNNQLPLLIKFIDAKQDLSIQVHPDDEMAKRLYDKKGKTEMWYIIDAEPGACLYSGFSSTLSKFQKDDNDISTLKEIFRQHVEDSTITDLLAKHEVKAGDVFYLPAGRVHAIGGGILLAEVQQSSDITYRIFDYNRLGTDGKPRELHTDLAAEAVDYHVEEEYRTLYTCKRQEANLVIDSPFFNVEITELEGSFHQNMLQYDSFVILMCLEGDCTVKISSTNDEVFVPEGYSTLIPAAIAEYDIIASNPTQKSKVLGTYINNTPSARTDSK